MTIPAIQFHADIRMASSAEIFLAGSHTATLLAGMALNTLLETVLGGSYALAHRVISMMLELSFSLGM